MRVNQPSTTGQRIRQIREARGLSQVQAAEAAHISQALWSAVELDQQVPTVRKAQQIARVLGATVDELWPREGA